MHHCPSTFPGQRRDLANSPAQEDLDQVCKDLFGLLSPDHLDFECNNILKRAEGNCLPLHLGTILRSAGSDIEGLGRLCSLYKAAAVAGLESRKNKAEQDEAAARATREAYEASVVPGDEISISAAIPHEVLQSYTDTVDVMMRDWWKDWKKLDRPDRITWYRARMTEFVGSHCPTVERVKGAYGGTSADDRLVRDVAYSKLLAAPDCNSTVDIPQDVRSKCDAIGKTALWAQLQPPPYLASIEDFVAPRLSVVNGTDRCK